MRDLDGGDMLGEFVARRKDDLLLERREAT
jgi:hypothetical protein